MFTGLYNAGVKLEVDQCYIMVVLGMFNTVTDPGCSNNYEQYQDSLICLIDDFRK